MDKRGRGMREGQQWRARLGSGQYTSRRASIPPCLEVRITSHGQLTAGRGRLGRASVAPAVTLGLSCARCSAVSERYRRGPRSLKRP